MSFSVGAAGIENQFERIFDANAHAPSRFVGSR
jgi:hypothetical protein